MTEKISDQRLDELTAKSELSPSIEKGKEMIGVWKESLMEVAEELRIDGVIKNETAYERIKSGVEKWSGEDPHKPDHGAFHSYYVYEGARYLAELEGKSDQVDDSLLQAEVVLHDIIQTIGYINPLSGDDVSGINVRKEHARIIATFTRRVGSKIGLDKKTVDRLAHALEHHDDVYEMKEYTPAFYEAALLSDADKLFGASLSRDPLEVTKQTLKRNLTGATGWDKWYVFRDLSTDERNMWRYGHRYVSDAASAVRHDLSRMKFFTKPAIEFAESRLAVASDACETVYGAYFDEQKKAIDVWLSGDYESVRVVGKDKNLPKVDLENQNEALIFLFNTDLNLGSEYLVSSVTPRGFKVEVANSNMTYVIDPSVGRFVFEEKGREKFLSEITSVVKGENVE